jgi:hypothetical protein
MLDFDINGEDGVGAVFERGATVFFVTVYLCSMDFVIGPPLLPETALFAVLTSVTGVKPSVESEDEIETTLPKV